MRLTVSLLASSLLGISLAAGAVAQSPESTTDGRRLEFPDGGLAITIPDEWISLREDEFGGDELLAVFASPADLAICSLMALPGAGPFSIDGLEEHIASAGYSGLPPDEIDTTRVQTAAGEALRLSYRNMREESGTWFSNAIYYFIARDSMKSLSCLFDEAEGARPADEWLSIAETFEWLPEGAPVETPAL